MYQGDSVVVLPTLSPTDYSLLKGEGKDVTLGGTSLRYTTRMCCILKEVEDTGEDPT